MKDIFAIGIDPSLTMTGIVVLKNGELHKTHVINTTKLQEKGPARLMFLRDEFKSFMDTIPNKDIVTYEDYSFGSKNRSLAYTIGELGGVFKLLMFEQGIKYNLVSPKSAQKFMLGGKDNKDIKTADKKSLTLKEILRIYKVDFDSLDLADAYVLAQLAWTMYQIREGALISQSLNHWQREAIERIEQTIEEKAAKNDKKVKKHKEEEDIL